MAKMRFHERRALRVAMVIFVLVSCVDSPAPPTYPPPPSGTIEIVVATRGKAADLDSDGYSVIVDGVTRGNVGINSTFVVNDLPPGRHAVRIAGRAANCFMNGAEDYSVSVFASSRSPVSLSIACLPKSDGVIGPLAYASRNNTGYYDLYALRGDWSGTVRLTTDAGSNSEPAWSPSGQRIAFTRESVGSTDIYIMDADGGNPVRLTTNTVPDYGPAWSPDGLQIAFVRERAGKADLFVMNADGSDQKQITSDSSINTAPDWSSDGTRIAFSKYAERSPKNGIWVIKPDGSEEKQITFNLEGDSYPAWSPDGKRIAFSRSGYYYYYIRELFVANADGTGVRSLRTASDASDPAWSPDGTSIAFTGGTARERVIRITFPDGEVLNQGFYLAPGQNPTWRK